MAPRKKAAPEASIGQRVFLARITGVDNRGKFVSAAEAEKVISEFVFKRDTNALMRGRTVRSTFEAQARRLYKWAQEDAHAPEILVRKVGRGWVFQPTKSATGFPA